MWASLCNSAPAKAGASVRLVGIAGEAVLTIPLKALPHRAAGLFFAMQLPPELTD